MIRNTLMSVVILSGVYACNQAAFHSRNRAEPVTAGPEVTPTEPINNPTTIASTPPTTTAAPTPTATTAGPGIIQIIGGLIHDLPDITILQPSKNDITIGGSKVFHIGNGQDADSSCQVGLFFYPTRGIQYFFEFNVLQDNTPIDISIDRICGVDYQTNFAYFGPTAATVTPIQTKQIPVGASNLKFDSTTLNKGTYVIIVESKENPANNNDRDDFVVGKIHIKTTPDKQITQGKVGAQN